MMVSIIISTQEGTTALLYAGWSGHSEVVKLLLGAGARDIPNEVGQFYRKECPTVYPDGILSLPVSIV